MRASLASLLALCLLSTTTLAVPHQKRQQHCSIHPSPSLPAGTGPVPSAPVPTVPAPPVSGGNHGLPAVGTLSSSWYPAWMDDVQPISAIPWSSYNVLTFAFGLTTPDPSVISFGSGNEETLLREFATTAKLNGVKASLSLGGWTGSRYFSGAVSTAANRAKFLKAITDIVTEYGLDGIDFDWEYPNKQGIGCNDISPEDSANFLTFLNQLRADPIGSSIILSAAVTTPFAGPAGTPLTDVSGFATVFDYISIMNYDLYGGWSATTGPNAPLADACAAAANQQGSATRFVKAWIDAGFPANKISLAVAAYSHSWTVEPSVALTGGNVNPYSAHATANPRGDQYDVISSAPDVCGVVTPGYSGIFNFFGMIERGYLNADGTANTAAGVSYLFDECSQTPFVYNPAEKVMVTYDDATSFNAKGEFIKSQGLLGFSMWHSAGDSNNILIDAIHGGMA